MNPQPVPKLFFGLLLVSFLAGGLMFAFDLGEMSRYSSRTWQTEDGLPHNFVSSVQPSRDGYLWMGTAQGLARFDGVRFTVFNSQNTPALKNDAISALCETRDGTLWIGFEKGGVSSLRNGKFSMESSAPDFPVKAMVQSRDGSLWIGTTGGLTRFKDGNYASFSLTNSNPDEIVLSLAEDLTGKLWVGTSHGLMVYNGRSFEIYPDPKPSFAASVRALFCDREGSLWIGSGGHGLERLKNGEFQYFEKPEGLPDGFINAIYEDRRGELWIGTRSGLCRRFGEKFVTERTPEGTSYTAINSFAEDNEGDLWLGTKEGLSQLQTKPFETYMREQGLGHNNVMSVCEDHQGTLWIATWGGGLSKFKNDQFIIYNYANSLLDDCLLSLHETRDGSVWIGADFKGGLHQFKEGVFTRYGVEEGLLDSAVRAIHEDRSGNLWVGTSGGLYLLKEKKFRRYTKSDGLVGNVIRVLCEDKEGNLWIGTSEGLTKRSGEVFSSFTTANGLSTNAVISLHIDSANNLWIGTDGGGLNRFADGKFSAYTTKQGLFNDSIFEILEDDRGNLWMSCLAGVFRVGKKDIDDLDRKKIHSIGCVSYGKADGMAGTQCNGVGRPAGWKSRDGRLWFPTTRGIAVIDPQSNVKEVGTAPPVRIEEINADEKLVRTSNPDRSSNARAGASDSVEINPGRGQLEFHYTALSFRAPGKNRFKYKLEGVDPDWVDAGIRRVAYYNNIKPGHYAFRVIASNNDGVWNALGASVALHLQPHYWQTWWFKGAIIIASISFVGLTVRYLTKKRMQLSLERLKQQHSIEKERTRIAQDMHDDLGARLSEILVLSNLSQTRPEVKPEETAAHMARISAATRDIVDNLDAVIWAVNPKNDSLDKFVLYIFEYLPLFLEASGIRFSFDVPKDLPSITLSSELRHNLFLVVKEALNNVLKHAAATQVRLILQLEGAVLSLAIEDNGKGLPAEAGSHFGNGLNNMQERIRSMNGTLAFSSQPGKGTRIDLKIPLQTSPSR